MSERIGDVFEAEVRDMASDGRGVLSHPAGRTVFVPGVWVGEKARIKLTVLKGRIGEGECVELLEASPQRRRAPCPHHGFEKGQCGACPWQFVDDTAQQAAKQQRVQHAFARLACAEMVKPLWVAPASLHYRNRAQLKTDGKRMGFLSFQSNTLAEIDACAVLSEKNAQTFAGLKQQLPLPAWRPPKRNSFTTLDIDESVDASSVRVNQRLPFQQANSAQNARMLQWLRDKLQGCDCEHNVLELFCGSGNLTQVITERGFASLTAVEAVAEALTTLNEKKLPGVTTLQADLFTEQGMDKVAFHCKKSQVLVLDPPRDGLKIKGRLFEKKRGLKKVFYISCDLATLTRDIKYMQEHGFKVKEVQPLDMFPQTPHIELLVHLQR